MDNEEDESKFLEILKKSPIYSKLKRVAPQFFDAYKKKMKKQYPYCTFEADREILIKDAEYSFASALKALFKEEKKEKRNIPGWSEGFVMGFVSSRLCTRWYSAHIYSNIKEYKQLMFLKSLIIYLEFDLMTTAKIEKIYNYLVDKNSGILEDNDYDYKDDKDEKIVSLEKFRNKREKAAPHKHNKEFVKSIVSYLESILLKEHNDAFDKNIPEIALDINDFFTYDEINSLTDFCSKKLKDLPPKPDES